MKGKGSEKNSRVVRFRIPERELKALTSSASSFTLIPRIPERELKVKKIGGSR